MAGEVTWKLSSFTSVWWGEEWKEGFIGTKASRISVIKFAGRNF